MPRRLAAIFLLLTFLGLGTGGFAYLHDLQHDVEDAREDAVHRAAGVPVEHHHHDEGNCPIHAQLHLPMVATALAVQLIGAGLPVSTVEPPPRPVLLRGPPGRADCRDPPDARAV